MTLFIIFADGGWIEFAPITRELVRTGTHWEALLDAEQPAPERIFRAVSSVDKHEAERRARAEAAEARVKELEEAATAGLSVLRYFAGWYYERGHASVNKNSEWDEIFDLLGGVKLKLRAVLEATPDA